jgi:methylglyoxal synthase
MTKKKIALVAHDNKKKELIQWSKQHRDSIEKFEVYATGTTADTHAAQRTVGWRPADRCTNIGR